MTMSQTRRRGIISLGPTVLSAGVLLAGGCGSTRSTYTAEHATAAKQRMDAMKSATEWDMARQNFLAGDLDKALRGVNTAINLNPNVAKSHLLRGRILLEMGDIDNAIDALNRTLVLDPGNAEAPYYLGVVHERVAQKEAALKHYSTAAEADPTSAQYAVAAAEILMDLGRLDEAESYLCARVGSFEHHPGVKQTLGHLSLLRGDVRLAAARFDEAHLLAPDDPFILEDVARTQVMLGQFAEAESNLSKLLSRPAATTRRGNKSTEEESQRRDLMYLRARCLSQLARPQEAREILLALTTDRAGGSDVEAWIELGRVAYQLRDHSRLRESVRRVGAIAPNRPESFVLRALMLRREGKLPEAAECAERAIALKPEASSYVLLGIIRQELGQGVAAAVAYRAALELEPASETTRRLLAHIESGGGLANVPTMDR